MAALPWNSGVSHVVLVSLSNLTLRSNPVVAILDICRLVHLATLPSPPGGQVQDLAVTHEQLQRGMTPIMECSELQEFWQAYRLNE
jgi:hypothetical protein